MRVKQYSKVLSSCRPENEATTSWVFREMRCPTPVCPLPSFTRKTSPAFRLSPGWRFSVTTSVLYPKSRFPAASFYWKPPSQVITGLVFQAAVPKSFTMKMEPLSGHELPPLRYRNFTSHPTDFVVFLLRTSILLTKLLIYCIIRTSSLCGFGANQETASVFCPKHLRISAPPCRSWFALVMSAAGTVRLCC